MVKVALAGGAYQAHSVIASAQRSLNLYSEPMPQAQGEPMPAANYPTPGLTLLTTIGSGPIRGIRQCTTGGVYVVSGSTLYSVDPTTLAATALGDLTPGLLTPVSMSDNGLDMLVVDGTANGWDVALASNAFAQINDPNGMFVGADRVDYLDTYFIFNKPGTPQFYISGSLAVTFDTLDFANKEAYSDLLVVAVVAKRLIYLFGERTTEIWYDAGATFSTTDTTAATSFQFAAMQSEVFIDHGCAAKYSPAVYDNSVFWLTEDRQGQGIVMMVAGYETKRVSTYAIEAEIAGYGRIDDAIGFTYQLAGHSFYVLTFPTADHTWSYDIATGLWHEWLWIDTNGAEHRHRANCFWPVNDTLVVGDWQNGNLYALDNRVFTDNGQPIKRVRSFPHILNDGKRLFYRQFLADMETGNPGSVPPPAGGQTLLACSFTATDGTLLQDYANPSDTNATWTLVSGSAQVLDDEMRGPAGGGSGLYSSAPLAAADYSLSFSAIPTAYYSVGTAAIYALARSSGIGTGYRAQVSGGGTQYWLLLGVEGGTSTSIAMGTLASGFYTLTMTLQGTTIILSAQRSTDGLWLNPGGTWGAGGAAITMSDSTYTSAGSVLIGGNW